MSEAAAMQMPKYVCHKEVYALKILEREWCDEFLVIRFVDSNYAPVKMSESWVYKHDPQPGGYYVVYEDGYTSFSPADAFEAGYTRKE